MERHIPETSRQAFHDPGNKERRKTTKELILDWLEAKDYPNGHSVREISEGIKKTYNATQKRVSELYHDGRIIVTGSQIEKKTPVHTYAFLSREVQKVRKSKLQIMEETIQSHYPIFYDTIKKEVELKFENQ